MADRQELLVESLGMPPAAMPRRKTRRPVRVQTPLPDVTDRLTRLMAEVRRRHRTFALVAINLDGFRLFRETYGQSHGDDMIKRAVSIVQAAPCPDVIVAQDGPDGFLVALSGLKSSAETVACVRQVLDAIALPRNMGAETLRLTASAGIAVFPKDGDDIETLSRNAWGAMRESQGKCVGSYRFHSEYAAGLAKRRLRLEMDLRCAIDNKNLTLHYQPQFEVSNGRASGVEALARWFRPGGATVEPAVFIPLAERTRMIGALGAWVLQEACKAVSEWRRLGAKPVTLCVNVSPHQLDRSLAATVYHALQLSGFPAQHLELEITESALICNASAVIESLHRLKALGVRIAIDDFGTGYSSLSYLSRLPVDRLKVDKSLIHNLCTRSKDIAILRSIIELGRELGLEVVAEGVETQQQLQVLQQLGCPQVQGYLLARPAPQDEALRMLAGRWGAAHTAVETAHAS